MFERKKLEKEFQWKKSCSGLSATNRYLIYSSPRTKAAQTLKLFQKSRERIREIWNKIGSGFLMKFDMNH